MWGDERPRDDRNWRRRLPIWLALISACWLFARILISRPMSLLAQSREHYVPPVDVQGRRRRYETAVAPQAAGMPLSDLGFEAQMHQFYAKSRAEKAKLAQKVRTLPITHPIAYATRRRSKKIWMKSNCWNGDCSRQQAHLQAKIEEIDGILANTKPRPSGNGLRSRPWGKMSSRCRNIERSTTSRSKA